MNEYLKQYIKLQKPFRVTQGNPDSVCALYAFKDELEQSEDKQAKEILVDVYDLLGFKKSAYDLLCQIGDRSDKKILKRLGTLKDYSEKSGGPSWACPPSNIILTLWIPGPLRNPRRALSATAAARLHISSIQRPFSPWRILRICALRASPVARPPGNIMAVFRTTTLWTMA